MKTKKSKSLLSLFLAVLMLVTSIPFAAFATDELGAKPADGTTEGRPFLTKDPSETIRIPGLVTMDDGTIVAHGEARWNSGMDGGGNDTMIARSTDNGNTWSYTLTNYYPDNGNVFNKASTGTCDSAIATDGKRVYLLTTFFPAGYALNNSSANNQVKSGDTAFDGNGRVKLTRTGDNGAYNYYLGEFQADGYARIYANSDNSEVSGYTVDHDFYLYLNGQKAENLFYSDCYFQTVKTNFLLFRTSDDNGATWSDFTLVNAKRADEAFYGVGPGRGIVTQDGTLVFGCYKWNGDNGSQRSSFIYSRDGGKTWTRTADLGRLKLWSTNGRWHSECQVIELEDNTIRLFARNDFGKIIYGDAKVGSDGVTYEWIDGTGTDGDLVGTAGKGPKVLDNEIDGKKFSIVQDCQYSAIKYSKKLRFNGKDYNVIVVSSALDSGRYNGAITTLFLDDNNTVVHAVQNNFQSGFYAYSCMTELPDGRIAILYESALDGTEMSFKIFDIEAMSGCRIVGKSETHNIDLAIGDERTVFTDESTATNSDESVASISFTDRTGSEAKMGENANFDGVTVPLRDALYDFNYDPDNENWVISAQGVFLTIYNKGIPSTKDKKSITIKKNGDYFQFVDSGNEALHFYRSGGSIYTWDRTTAYGNGSTDGNKDEASTLFDVFRPLKIGETNSASDPVPGYTKVTKLEDIADKGQYLIGCQVEGSYYFLYPSLSTSNSYSHAVKCTGESVSAGSFMKISALKTGTTTIVCGLDTYIVTVSDYSREILGVVDYDPVIYTHGTAGTEDMSHTMCGTRIADGSQVGERKTEYRMNSSNYTITRVTAVGADGNSLSNSAIKFDGGYLSGNLSLADDAAAYADYTKGTYVTLKTELREASSGDVYTQTDRLYVTSNPVAGHVITGTRSAGYNQGETQLCTFILANGSIGNTIDGKNRSYSGVAKHMYTYADTDTSDGMRYQNAITQIIYDTADKKAGFLENSNGQGGFFDQGNKSTENYNLNDTTLQNGTQVAYYYYDKSSPKNEGINVPDKNHPENFEIVMSRQKVNVERTTNQNERLVTIGSDYNTNSTITAFMGNDTRRSVIKKLKGSGSITEQAYMFGVAGSQYYINSADHQKSTTIQCSTQENGVEMVNPNSPVTLNGVLRYQEGTESAGTKSKSWNDVRLTFEIRMCDKSQERDAYNETYSKIRKSTTYTEESWARYMNASLLYQEYLNNYTIQSVDEKRKYNTDTVIGDGTYKASMEEANIDEFYNNITKRADFTELEKAIADNEYLYNGGIDGTGVSYTPDSYTAFENAYNSGTDLCEQYPEDDRKNLAGYKPGVDIDTTEEANKLDIQKDIDKATAAIKAKPVEAADDDAYVAARAVSAKIDKTAYTDDGAKVDGAVETGNNNIYADYKGRLLVNIPATVEGQDKLDGYTTTLLEEMNVSNEASVAKTFHVDFTVNGTKAETVEKKEDYRYGTVANIDLTEFMSDEYTVKCIVNSVDKDTTKKETEINLADCGYKLSLLMQENLEVKVEVTTNPVITIVDYFGTVIATLNGTSVTVAGDKLTVGDVTVTAVQAPKYKFAGWSLKDGTSLESGSTHEITSATTIKQVGVLNSTDHIVTAVNGKVNGKDQFDAKHLDLKMTLTADDANAKYWTRTVDGVTSLASYENKFVVFTTNEDVTFTAYNDVNDLPNTDLVNQVNEAIPAVYATGYMANDKFVMSCDYSAPDTVKVLSAGVIYSNTASTADTLVKGASGTVAYASNNISHWNGASEKEKLALSGTFTMSKSKNIYDGTTHYMRAFVCYTAKYNGKDIPYVAYSDKIYKCQNGVVTAVN